jgi:hypothetical protein
MPVAYRIPLPENYRDEFDALELRGTKQTVAQCPLTFGARYLLITAEDESTAMIAHNRNRIKVAIAGAISIRARLS